MHDRIQCPLSNIKFIDFSFNPQDIVISDGEKKEEMSFSPKNLGFEVNNAYVSYSMTEEETS